MTRRLALSLRRWIDSSAAEPPTAADAARRIDWPRVLPFVLLQSITIDDQN
jgi:hypothetical protein